jgi:hypothetical protein
MQGLDPEIGHDLIFKFLAIKSSSLLIKCHISFAVEGMLPTNLRFIHEGKEEKGKISLCLIN